MQHATKNALALFVSIFFLIVFSYPYLRIQADELLTSKLWLNKAQETINFSNIVINNLQARNFTALATLQNPLFSAKSMHALSDAFNQLFPKKMPTNVTLVSLRELPIYGEKPITETQATLQYQFDKDWFLVNLIYHDEQSEKKLIGLHFYKLQNSLENIYKINLLSANLKQLGALIMATIVSLSIMIALLLLIYDTSLERKWLWGIFIILGFVIFNFNWTTQTYYMNLTGIQIFGAVFFRENIYTPLFIKFSIPLGAIIYLTKRFMISFRKPEVL